MSLVPEEGAGGIGSLAFWENVLRVNGEPVRWLSLTGFSLMEPTLMVVSCG